MRVMSFWLPGFQNPRHGSFTEARRPTNNHFGQSRLTEWGKSIGSSQSVAIQPHGHGSKPMVPFWGFRCTILEPILVVGLVDVHHDLAFDPCPHVFRNHDITGRTSSRFALQR